MSKQIEQLMLFCIVSRRHPTEVWDRRKQEPAAKGVIELRLSGVTNLQRVTKTGERDEKACKAALHAGWSA